MFLLDTNVVSVVMAPSPPQAVLDWLNEQDTLTLYLSTITVAEIGYGLGILPDGKRRRSLERRFERFVREGFEQRVLDFDLAAARLYGEIMSHRRAIGRPMSMADGQIAAIARSRDLAVASRNEKDFQECGLSIFNPFA